MTPMKLDKIDEVGTLTIWRAEEGKIGCTVAAPHDRDLEVVPVVDGWRRGIEVRDQDGKRWGSAWSV